MEFTEIEAIYAFNAIELHQMDVQDALMKLKEDVRKDLSVFLNKAGDINTALNDLETASDIQFKILSSIGHVDKQQAIEDSLNERKAWIQEMKKGFKKALTQTIEEMDE